MVTQIGKGPPPPSQPHSRNFMAFEPVGVENEMDAFTCRQSVHSLTGLRRPEASTAGLASIKEGDR